MYIRIYRISIDIHMYIYIHTYIHHAEIPYICIEMNSTCLHNAFYPWKKRMDPAACWIAGSYIEPRFNNKQYMTQYDFPSGKLT